MTAQTPQTLLITTHTITPITMVGTFSLTNSHSLTNMYVVCLSVMSSDEDETSVAPDNNRTITTNNRKTTNRGQRSSAGPSRHLQGGALYVYIDKTVIMVLSFVAMPHVEHSPSPSFLLPNVHLSSDDDDDVSNNTQSLTRTPIHRHKLNSSSNSSSARGRRKTAGVCVCVFVLMMASSLSLSPLSPPFISFSLSLSSFSPFHLSPLSPLSSLHLLHQ